MSKKENSFNHIFIANQLSNDAEFIPLLSDDEEDALMQAPVPEMLPILPLRNTVLFPGVLVPITVNREKSIKLIREAYQSNRLVGAVAQRDPSVEDPAYEQLFITGTVGYILKILEMPDGSISVIMQGKKRFELGEMGTSTPYFVARIKTLDEIKPEKGDKEFEAILSSLRDVSLKILKLSANVPPEASFALRNIESSSFLINYICSNSEISLEERQKLLETAFLKERGIILLQYLNREVQLLELKNDIQLRVRSEIEQQQKEYFLNQQMKTIQDELGGNPLEKEIAEMRTIAGKKKWTKEVADIFEKEISKLQRLNPNAADYSVQINYLETLLELPWSEYTRDNFNMQKAQKVLDKDHYGLEKVKERILEHLAVLKLKKDLKAPILCLYGPPGVGKTSLGKSIAKSLGRKYVRMSLGGLHDEAEIRGHRKTYIGAMPGRIIQNLKKAGSANPVFILDEIDKVGSDFRGDPASALLEVLDPEQNNTFHDNYLDVDFDLSKVMFIATANNIGAIHPALRDRMEIIDVSGYILEEKIEIAIRHLIPRQIEDHGVNKKQFILNKDVLSFVIENYTRESGVRDLDKKIAKLVRNRARKIAFDEKVNANITIEDAREILGAPVFTRDKYLNNDIAGVVTGLAWTAVGGEILFVETSLSRGNGKLTLTGNLGDVMKESAVIALEYLRSHSFMLGLDPELFDHWNVHIHVPEGAIPKDGPSAGVTMITSLASAFTQRKVKQRIAMTGEITLRGTVTAIGGVKEKILAAKRAGITEILLPEENRKDIEEINSVYLEGLTFHYIGNISKLLELALTDEKVDNPIDISIPKKKEKEEAKS
jgi:ATP-dependent Lon protease